MPAPHVAQTGLIALVGDSGPIAQGILTLLFLASVFCWMIIVTKWRSLKTAVFENNRFLNVFWHGKSIDEIMAKVDQFPKSPVAAVFKSGVKELKKLSSTDPGITGSNKVDNTYRALTRTANSEIAALEKHVSWLATTASAAPFVGLFGTVLGIMNAFQNIGATGSANLAVVAPGISEALVATAAGIGAAIPAVVAYNYFVGQIKRLSVDMECFSQDFLNIIQRSVLGERKGG